MERNIECIDALSLKKFLNTIADERLEGIPISCTYSDDVEEGHCEVYISRDEEESICQLIGATDCV